MIRQRHQRPKDTHWGILVNKAATRYDIKAVNKLVRGIKDAGGVYTVVEPSSAHDLVDQARRLVSTPPTGPTNGGSGRKLPITALIAAGGDGTVNLVGRAAIEADLPIGILPMGRMNNVVQSLAGDASPDHAVARILRGEYKKLDAGNAGGLLFFDAIGFGFIPKLSEHFRQHRPPRFGLGWNQLGAKLADEVRPEKLLLKIDAYRMDITPTMLQVNLLKYAAGIPLSDASLTDDGQMEVIFDQSAGPQEFGNFLKQVVKRKFLYGTSFRLYRSTVITCSPTQGRSLYLDGEIITVPANVLEITMSGKQLRVYC